MADVALDNVSKHFGGFVGVERIDLHVRDEEFVVLLGPSGCGKTTTMRMIAGLIENTTGEIRIGGQLMNDVEPRDRDVAMVFQSYALYPNMSIYENIRFPLRMRGFPRDQQDRKVREAAALAELTTHLDRKPRQLSGGQRQRAALARAIVRAPRLFLMDEPLSNLDAKLRLTMRGQLKHMQRTLRTTTIYVTHDQIEAITLADRIVVMDQGRVQQIGSPDDIYTRPETTFVAGFIGAPPMNLLEGEIAGRAFVAEGFRVPGAPMGARAGVVLGIRPEDVRIVAEGDGGTSHVAGKIYAVEPMGDHTLVCVHAGGQVVNVKTDRAFRQAIDTPVTLAFDPADLHWFDSQSGQRLAFGDAASARATAAAHGEPEARSAGA